MRADDLAAAHGELIVVAVVAGEDLDRQLERVGQHRGLDIVRAADAGGREIQRLLVRPADPAKVLIGDCCAITNTRGSVAALPIHDILVRSNLMPGSPMSWL